MILCTSIIICIEYSIRLLNSLGKQDFEEDELAYKILSQWKNFVDETLCYVDEPLDETEDGCYTDWNNWLSIGSIAIPTRFFTFEFTLLMISYFARFFTEGQVELDRDQ